MDSNFYEFRDCVRCECKWIEDCPHIIVELGGKVKLPIDCWREDRVKIEPKPHNKVSNNEKI